MYREIYEELERTGRVKSAVLLGGEHAGSRCMVKDGQCVPVTKEEADWTPFEKAILETKETGVCRAGETELFVEIFLKNPHLIILGGGHVSRPTARIGKMLGFHVTVMDDREEFVTPEHFPDADERITGSFEELDKWIPPYENAYYVIVTRGHKGDSTCARHIFSRPYAYLGMIGSKTKVKLTREKLLEEGFTAAQLDTLHAPIGLPIGGSLPEEIAVSIMAQIVQVKNAHYAAYCDSRVEEYVREGKRGVMMTLVKKSGSSPRGVGSKMFVETQDRKEEDRIPAEARILSTQGSIGGGNVEYEATKHCAFVTGTEVASYTLTSRDGQENLGMICGGKVEVLFEKVG